MIVNQTVVSSVFAGVLQTAISSVGLLVLVWSSGIPYIPTFPAINSVKGPHPLCAAYINDDIMTTPHIHGCLISPSQDGHMPDMGCATLIILLLKSTI